MALCVVTRRLPGSGLERLAERSEVSLWPHQLPPDPDTLAGMCEQAQGLLSTVEDRIDAEFLDRCKQLRAIANYAVGWDNIDLEAASQRGIAVGNTPDVLTETTADLGFALMLAAARRVVEGADVVRSGEWKTWDPRFLLGFDVHGQTLGVVGYGRIGRAVARRAEGFSMNVLWSSRNGGIKLESLLSQSDFVVLTVPLTAETFHLINRETLSVMKPSAVLVNIARGAIVDTDALESALREREIAAAALDVTDPEPLPAGHPLLRAPGALVVPHIGSASHATRERMTDMAVDNLLCVLAGRPMPHCVNPEVFGAA